MSKATTAERALNRKGGTMSRLIKTLFGFYPVLLPLVVVGVVLCAIINSIGATLPSERPCRLLANRGSRAIGKPQSPRLHSS